MLLNPAERFKEIIDQARSVILAGGTMEPISDFMRQLFPAIPKEKITTLSCRHVIPKENLLTQVVTVGPRKVNFEFKFSTRGDEAIVRRFLEEVKKLISS
jgi:chromosome transmission fidelity protein 1